MQAVQLFAVSALIIFSIQKAAASLSRYGPNVCRYTSSYVGSRYTTVSYRSVTSYRTCCRKVIWCVSRCTRYRSVTKYRTEVRYVTNTIPKYACCNGWKRGNTGSCSVPICKRPACLYGNCVRPNKCSCSRGYTNAAKGCNTDVNECASRNGRCEHKCFNTPGSFRCACRSGFRLVARFRCRDINECAVRNGGCNHQCSNTIGSYICRCRKGYVLQSNKRTCSDVNECASRNGGCQHTCINTQGSFRCACRSGFSLLGLNRCQDINECASRNGRCKHKCINTPGSFRCACRSGFRLVARFRCQDINECAVRKGGCNHQCSNTIGSYICRCRKGYVLQSNKRTCSDVNECASRNGGCQHTCINTQGSFRCACRSGFSLLGLNRCQDINECASRNGRCKHKCINTPGSFRCACRSGFRLVERFRCQDINECAVRKGGCNHQCSNTIGSYICRCRKGYVLQSNKRTCSDVNECASRNGGCQHTCINTQGSFRCACRSGFSLLGLNRCQDINECASRNGRCKHKCINTPGSFRCACRSGFRLVERFRCQDINECAVRKGGCNHQCSNTIGSYICRCRKGYVLQSNKRTCSDVNECASRNGGCQHTCINTQGSFRCACRSGFSLLGLNRCQDINECASRNGRCKHKCINTPGSFRCACRSGFRLVERFRCQDINECAVRKGGCNHQCSNTIGSYICRCRKGYVLQSNKRTCSDVNECASRNGGCQHTCINTQGSFRCACRSGFSLLGLNRCQDINECASRNGRCKHKCINTPGSFRCACRSGFRLVERFRCQDINECAVRKGGCNHQCSNTIGSYICRCRKGYVLQSNKRTCSDVNECASRNGGCQHTCINTQGSFRCACRSGFSLLGSNRCQDINECASRNGRCKHKCINTPGSFRCACRSGFRLVERFRCQDINECAVRKGGCNHQCSNTIGSYICRCRKGYVLQSNKRTCSDVNECASMNGRCEQKCINTQGSFRCACRSGFRLLGPYRCQDINECATMNGRCEHTCINTPGSFRCACRSGFRLASTFQCQDIDECATESNGCQQTCINSVGSYICRCLLGYQLMPDGRSCNGLPCMRHPHILDGNGTCFSGKTNDTCRFRCIDGFHFRGSKVRRCQANHTWSGSSPTCTRKSCDALWPPLNGGISYPCFRYFRATCNIHCSPGYYATGPTERTCSATANNTMYWNNAATRCDRVTVCTPNPCQHGGRCSPVSEGKYVCNCNGTDYAGARCDRGVIRLPIYPIMDPAKEYYFTVTAKVNNELRIMLVANDNSLSITPAKLLINSSLNIATFTMSTNASGLYVLTYILYGEDSSIFDTPLNSIVYVRQSNTPKEFDDIITYKGSISKGCYSKEVQNSNVKGGYASYTMYSTTPWDSKIDHESSTAGIVLVDINGTSQPLSLAGTNITYDGMENKKLYQFINEHKHSDSKNLNTAEVDKSVKCVSMEPSSKYLSEIIELNLFPKMVVDGVNKRTSSSFNIVADRSIRSFSNNDVVANIQSGTDLKTLHPKCGHVLKGILDAMKYYAYTTNQTVLLQIADEEVTLNGDNKFCIFESISDNHTLIGFPNSPIRLKSWEYSTGWTGKISSIHFHSTNGSQTHRVFGEYSTMFKSANVKVNIKLNGEMQVKLKRSSELFTSGLNETQFISANGAISLYIDDNSTGIVRKSKFSGNGSIRISKIGNDCQHVVVYLKNVIGSVSDPLLHGRVKLDKNATIVYNISVADNGGAISEDQNLSHFHRIYEEMSVLNATIVPVLQESFSNIPISRELMKGALNELQLAVSISESLSLQPNKERWSMLLPYLTDLKRHLISLDRSLQVLAFRHKNMGGTFSDNTTFGQVMEEFQNNIVKMQKTLKRQLKRTELKRLIKASTMHSTGEICLMGLCFKTCFLEISYEVLSKRLAVMYNITVEDENVTAIFGKLCKDEILGNHLRLPKYGTIVLVVNRSGKVSGFFNASIQMYGRKYKFAVLQKDEKLFFSTVILLPDGSEAILAADSDIREVILPKQVAFTIKAVIGRNTYLIRNINELLRIRVMQMPEYVLQRKSTLRKAVNILKGQKIQAELYLKRLEKMYAMKIEMVSVIEIEINRTLGQFEHRKSVLIDRLKQYNGSITNHIDIAEECLPQICVQKCIPRLVAGICFTNRYEHAVKQSCARVAKYFFRFEVQQKSLQRSYLAYNAQSSYQTKCSRLAGFFQKVNGDSKQGNFEKEKTQDEPAFHSKQGNYVINLAKKVLKEITSIGDEKIFETHEAIAEALGTSIGSFLPGTSEIVGKIFGGVVGSSFGSCEKLYTTKRSPKLITSTHFDAAKVPKMSVGNISVCESTFVRQKLASKSKHECYFLTNCSQAITDARCAKKNQYCQAMRSILRERIKEDSDLSIKLCQYEQFSLAVEILQLRKHIAIQERRNAYQRLSVAKAMVLKSKFAYESSKESLAYASDILWEKLNVINGFQSFGLKEYFVQNAFFNYEISRGKAVPNIISLIFDYKQGNGLGSNAMAWIDLQNMNLSISDAADAILQFKSDFNGIEMPPPPISRDIRSVERLNEPRVSIIENYRNMIRGRCKMVERNILYLLEISIIFAEGIAQFNLAKLDIANAELVKQDFVESIQDNSLARSICSERNDSTNNTNDLLRALFENVTTNSGLNDTIISWKAKRADIIANTEYFTRNQNFVACGGTLDCILVAIDDIFQLIRYGKSNAAKFGKQQIPEWKSYFQCLLEQEDLDEYQTKLCNDNLKESIKRSNINKIYCGSPPVIVKDLPARMVVTALKSVQLQIEIVKSLHQVFYQWEKDGEQLQKGNSSVLKFSKSNELTSGFYACHLWNTFGSVLSKIVHVIYQEKPKIISNPADLTTTIKGPSSSIQLICNATGTPPPVIEWLFVPFNDTSKPLRLHENESILLINSTRQDQSGFYYCNASNTQGFAISRNARVHVKNAVIAEFAIDISFVVAALNHTNNKTRNQAQAFADRSVTNATSFTNKTAVENKAYIANDTSVALNKTNVAKETRVTNNTSVVNDTVVHLNETMEHSTADRKVTQSLPKYLSAESKSNLTVKLSRIMNVSKSRIRSIELLPEMPQQGIVLIRIIAKDLNPLLGENRDWTMLTEDIVMARKGLLVLPLWLQFFYSNMTSVLKIGNVNSLVNPDTVRFALGDPLCPVGYSLNSNGFICETCTAGTMFHPAAECQKCPIGTYQPNQEALQCIECNSTHTTESFGSVYSGQCIPKEPPAWHDHKRKPTQTAIGTRKRRIYVTQATSSPILKSEAAKEGKDKKKSIFVFVIVVVVVVMVVIIIIGIAAKQGNSQNKKENTDNDEASNQLTSPGEENYELQTREGFCFENQIYEQGGRMDEERID